MRRAAVISIDVEAGTAKMLAQLQQAKAGLREFGASGASSMAPTTVALRELEGNLANNTRGVARFLGQTLGLGPVLQKAFPLIGGIAFGGMLVSLGGKVVDFFKKMADGPKKIADAFRELNAPLHATNIELQLSNARLEDEIAKLQGKQGNNGLKIALLETATAADKLAESLDKDIKKADDLIAKEGVSRWRAGFTGEQSTGYIQDYFKQFQSRVDQIKQATGSNGQAYMEAMTSPTGPLWEALHQVEKWRAGATTPPRLWGQQPSQAQREDWTKSHASEVAALDQFERLISEQMNQFAASGKEAALKGIKAGLEESAAAAKRLKEQLAEVTAESARAAEAMLAPMARVDAEEQSEIARRKELLGLKPAQNLPQPIAAAIEKEYNARRADAYLEDLANFEHYQEELAALRAKIDVEGHELLGKTFADDIEKGKKAIEDFDKALTKVNEEFLRLRQAGANQALSHQVRMIGLQANPSDPLGTLAKQQAVEMEAIQTRYNDQIALASAIQDKTLRQHSLDNAELEKSVALAKLQNDLEEKRAEMHPPQADMRSFFLDMQRDAQTGWNIFYEAGHEAVDKLSSQFAKLLTGQKTSFGKMFEGIGDEMLEKSIKSGFERGLGALGNLLGIHAAAKSPQHVIVDNMPAAAIGGGKDPFAGLGVVDASGNPLPGVAQSSTTGIGGFLRKIFSSPTSTGTPDLGGAVQSAAGGFPRNGNAAGAGAVLPIAPNVPTPAGGWPILSRAQSPRAGTEAGGASTTIPNLSAPLMGESNETLRKAGAVLPIAPNVPTAAGGWPIFGGVLAAGGEVSPGVTYWAGDVPEFFTPKTAGTVTPLSKLAQLNTQLAGKTSETTKPAPAFPGADHLPVGRDDQLADLQAHFQKLYPGATAPSGIPGYLRPSNTQLAGKASETSAIARFAEGGIVTAPTVGLLGDQGDEAVIPLQGTGTNVFSRLLQKLTGTGQKQSFSKIFEGAGQDAINETASSGRTHRPIHVIIDNWPASLGGDRGGAVNASGNPLASITSPGTPVPDLRTLGLAAITSPNAAPGTASFLGPAANPAPWYASLAKIFGGSTTATGSTGPSAPSFAFASDFGGFLAEGGDVDPGRAYGIAEAGDAELFMPRSAGSVTPLSQLGGGDTYHTWQIDARGADLGVASRIDQIMSGAHNSAIVTAIRANTEMAKRRPRMT
jgi:hypothetical protein